MKLSRRGRSRSSATSASPLRGKTRRPPCQAVPIVTTSFKNVGVRRIVNHYNELESEVTDLRRLHYESRLKVTALKDALRAERSQSRKILALFTMKFFEKEHDMAKLQAKHEAELNMLTAELNLLRGNLMREQKHLAVVIEGQRKKIGQQQEEINRLRQDSDTSESSRANSPDSDGAFRVPKFHIRPRVPNDEQAGQEASRILPPPLPPPVPGRRRRVSPPLRGHVPDEAFVSCADDEKASNCQSDSLSVGDEGFSSSHEDGHHQFEDFLADQGLQQSLISRLLGEKLNISPSITSTNHRAMLKPKDVKKRALMKSAWPRCSVPSTLSVVEEHQVTSCDGGSMATVIRWNEEN